MKEPEKLIKFDFFVLLKIIFYWLTTFFSLILYRHLKIKCVNFPINREELKNQTNQFIRDNKLIPDQAKITAVDIQDTIENEKDNIFINITYIIDNKIQTKNLFIKFHFRKDRGIKLIATDNAIRFGRLRELYFYENIAKLVPIEMPKFVCGRFHPFSSFGFLVFEKIENKRLIHDDQEISFDLISLCVKNMAKLHARFFNYDFSTIRKYFPEKKNSDLFSWVLLSKKIRKNGDFVIVFTKLCHYIDHLSSTLIHSDYRQGNILFPIENSKDEDIVVVDWYHPSISLVYMTFAIL